MNQFVLAITGPAGAGKSTVATILSKRYKKCAKIIVDDIKHMTKGEFTFELDADGTKQWTYHAWKLVGDNIGLLAENFLRQGYSVLIEGYIDVEGWQAVENRIKLTHKVVLVPDLETTIARDKLRPEEFVMGEKSLEESIRYFSDNEYFKDFARVDSTGHSAEQTADEIQKVVENQ
jgi:ABC-type cobalamin/Fe3+-siderophores transport system ATPase subunit